MSLSFYDQPRMSKMAQSDLSTNCIQIDQRDTNTFTNTLNIFQDTNLYFIYLDNTTHFNSQPT